MGTEPIALLKRDLEEVSLLLDRLQDSISSSDQQASRAKFQLVRRELSQVQQRLEQEFGWLAPKDEEE